MVPGNPGDREYQRQYALSRHGNLAARAAGAHQPGLPAVRHPARGFADAAASAEFYAELVRTQQVLNRKHLGWSALRGATGEAARLLLRGQTNFVRMLWRFNSVFDPRLQLADHAREVSYAMSPPPGVTGERPDSKSLYVHGPAGRRSRAIDDATESFVEATRMGV